MATEKIELVEDDDYDKAIHQRLKVIIVGDRGSGKHTVAKGADICVPFKTFGVSFGKKTRMDRSINYKLTLLFWTLTEGRPRPTTYMKGASAAIIMGNLKSRTSMENMNYWANIIHSYVGDIPLFFIGVKDDLEPSKRAYKLLKLARNYHGRFYILRTAEEHGIKRILRAIGKRLARKYFNLFKNRNFSEGRIFNN